MTAPLVFLDTETTALHVGREAWDIGMIRREPDGVQNELQLYVDVELLNADPASLRIGGFYERHPQGRRLSNVEAWAGENIGLPLTPKPGPPSPSSVSRLTAARQVARMTHGAHIVGAVPSFDTEVLTKLLRSCKIIPAWHYHLVDVEALAMGYLCGREYSGWSASPPWSSDELSAALGIETPADERHTAIGDARWAMRVFDAITSGVVAQ